MKVGTKVAEFFADIRVISFCGPVYFQLAIDIQNKTVHKILQNASRNACRLFYYNTKSTFLIF